MLSFALTIPSSSILRFSCECSVSRIIWKLFTLCVTPLRLSWKPCENLFRSTVAVFILSIMSFHWFEKSPLLCHCCKYFIASPYDFVASFAWSVLLIIQSSPDHLPTLFKRPNTHLRLFPQADSDFCISLYWVSIPCITSVSPVNFFNDSSSSSFVPPNNVISPCPIAAIPVAPLIISRVSLRPFALPT